MDKRILSFLVTLALIFSACDKDMTFDEINALEEVIATDEVPEKAIATDEIIETSEESIVLLLTDFAKSSSETEYTVTYNGLAAIFINGTVQYVTQFILTDDDGNTLYAYCADMSAPAYEGAKYKVVSASDYFNNGEEEKIMAALAYISNVYGWMETTNPDGYMQLIQAVIWRIIHGYEVSFVYNADGAMIRDVIEYIYNNVDDLPKDYSVSVTMEGADLAVEDGVFVNYGPYNVSKNAILTNVYFNLTFDLGGNSAKFVDKTGMEITRVKSGEAFYIRVPANDYGDFKFSAAATVTRNIWSVDDFKLFNDVREGNYQPLFCPIETSVGAETNFYVCSGSFTKNKDEEECGCGNGGDEDITVETITLSALNWNNGNGAGINSFDVNGVTLKHNKNYTLPANFDAIIAKTPDKNDNTAIFTVTERTVTNNGKYEKVYDVRVALYEDGQWKVYGGTITVDNPGGNNKNQKIELERIL